MSGGVRAAFNTGRVYKRLSQPYNRRIVGELPVAYQKFFQEWVDETEKEQPVHWVPREGKWERNPETGEV
jgi:hypothetical protein